MTHSDNIVDAVAVKIADSDRNGKIIVWHIRYPSRLLRTVLIEELDS